jgi:hypothetical protein
MQSRPVCPSAARPELEKLFELQSRETDRDKRKHLVWEIDRRLQGDGARPIIHRRGRRGIRTSGPPARVSSVVLP